MPHAITEQDISYKGVDMLWLTYTLIGVLFFFLILIYIKIKKKTDSIPTLAVVAAGCSFVVFMLLYIPLQVYAPRVNHSVIVKLSPLSCSSSAPVYVIAVAVSGDSDLKKYAYIVNIDHEGFPSQGIFTEGEARLSFEQRVDGVIEKSSTRLTGRALWFTSDQPRHEYIVRVPIGSMERPARVKEFW